MERAFLPGDLAKFARLGFADTKQAAETLEANPILEPVLATLRDVGDPDLALSALARIVGGGGADIASWTPLEWMRITAVLGASQALGEHLARHPEQLPAVLKAEHLDPKETVFQRINDAVRRNGSLNSREALRVAYRRELCAIAAVDLSAQANSIDLLSSVAQALADLADVVMECALEIASGEVTDSDLVDLSIIAMGKCGARELNYISDVDVIFVAAPVGETSNEDAIRIATTLARTTMAICMEPNAYGSIWEVDAALRPEGKAGALVRTVESHVDYYIRWAQTWEFQALLKARPMAGNRELGQRYMEAIMPLVWSAAGRDNFVEDVQAMRRRVTQNIPANEAQRELKLGAGGLRDVEFAVQLLQLVHGRSDVMVRSPNTLLALEQLSTWGYIARADSSTLIRAYQFLRTLEHRIQLFELRRTHLMPEDPGAQLRLARSLGYIDGSDLLKDWAKYSREIRRIHEKLFYRPLLSAVAKLDGSAARLTPEAARIRLHALGFQDPESALRHLESLTGGVTRRAVIQRTLLPVMLEWFADAPDPDYGLLAFRKISEALGATPWYLRLLRDESTTAQRLATILATSRYATDLLLRAPEAVDLLANPESLTPRSRDVLMSQAIAMADRYEEPQNAVSALRAFRRLELFRLSAADVLGETDIETVGLTLTYITDAVLAGTLHAITRRYVDAPAFGVIAMGRYGGAELSYSSDVDVMFIYAEGDDRTRDAQVALQIATQMRSLLMAPSSDPELVIDADLRPEGKNGPLVRSLESFASYYDRWSSHWEAQALLRADWACGDEQLESDFRKLIDPIRYPEIISADLVREVRRLKARMEAERLPRGVDPALHTKLGRGGLSDVEWVIQLMQLRHGHQYESLRTPRTLKALDAAVELGLLEASDHEVLKSAWKTCSRVRNANLLLKGKASDLVPSEAHDRARVAWLLGFGQAGGTAFDDEYRRRTRRARVVMERLFFDS